MRLFSPSPEGGFMQRKNALAMEYLDDEERIADFINVVYFQGKNVVNALDVHDADGVQYRVKGEGRKKKTRQYSRDKLRKVVLGMQCMFIGIEHQSAVNYMMPLRVMGYDLASYERQVKALGRGHRRKKDLKGSEYISGIASSDRLWPSLTVVLYMGNEPWAGPCDLHDMLELDGKLAAVKKYVPNYVLHIVDVNTYSEWERFTSDLRQFFGYMRHQKDKKELMRYLEEHGKEYEDMPEEMYDLLSCMTDWEKMKRIKENNRVEGGINMTKAWEEWIESERAEGFREGEKRGEKRGEERMNCLYRNLLRDSRMEDMKKAMSDGTYRRKLCEEYNV